MKIHPNGYWWASLAIGVLIKLTTGSWVWLIFLALLSAISLLLGRSVSNWLLEERLDRAMRDKKPPNER